MKSPVILVAVIVMTLVLPGCFLEPGTENADSFKDSQQQSSARAEVSSEYGADGLAERDLAQIYYERGSVFAAMGHTHRSIEHFDEAISLDPLFAEAYFTRGMANIELGQLQRAIQDFDRALQISPMMAHAYVGRGRAYIALGMRLRALLDLTEAMRLNPDYSAELERITFVVSYCPPLDPPQDSQLDC